MKVNKKLKNYDSTEQVSKTVGVTLQGLVSTSVDLVDEYGWEASKKTVDKLSVAAFEMINYWELGDQILIEYANIMDELALGAPVDPLIVVELLNMVL